MTQARAAAAMELRDVHVAYHGDINILNGLNLTVAERCVTGIIGPNGSGKSTALKTMYGFLPPRRGDILLYGERINGLPPYEFISRGVAYVPQNRSLFNELSVEDNLRLGCWAFRRDHARVAEALEHAFQHFPILREKRSDPAGSMSGGQQRLLELGRALLLKPRILLLDEPTSALDASIQAEVLNLLDRLRAEHGLTYLLVSHDLAVVAHMCDRLLVMQHAKAVESLTRATLQSGDPREAYTKSLLSASEGYRRGAV